MALLGPRAMPVESEMRAKADIGLRVYQPRRVRLGSLAMFAAIRRASSYSEKLGHKVGLTSLMTGTPLPFQLPPLSSSRAKQLG